jgi:hypothetical protein
MEYHHEQVRVTQYVQIVPGANNVLDTVLIYYTAKNTGTAPQKIGIRVMLDTFIGNNDGVPFTVPGEEGFVTTKAEYEADKVPDYVEVIENPDSSSDPGTIARVGLKGLRWGDVELLDPEKVRICQFPGKFVKWDWDVQPIGKGKGADSCVAVYWPEKDVAAKGTMHVAMTYGLGKLEISEKLAISLPRSARPGKAFVVTAYIYGATKGQTVKLDLPAGVELVEGSAEQAVAEDAKRTQVFWKVRAPREGNFPISATSGRARAQPVNISVQNKSIFG